MLNAVKEKRICSVSTFMFAFVAILGLLVLTACKEERTVSDSVDEVTDTIEDEVEKHQDRSMGEKIGDKIEDTGEEIKERFE